MDKDAAGVGCRSSIKKTSADGCLQTDAAVSELLRSEATQGARGIRPPVNETPQASAAVLRQKKDLG